VDGIRFQFQHCHNELKARKASGAFLNVKQSMANP
jgi:hypothetical protein